MQKSKKALIIFLSLICILFVIALILIFQDNKKDRLIKLYKKVLESKSYTFSMEEDNKDYVYKMTVSQKENNIKIDTQSGDDNSSTLILDGRVYVIMHKLKEYYIVDGDNVDGDIIISGLKEMANEKYVNGREEINGKTYYYEEYKDKSNFLKLVHETDDAKITTKFYFDNNNLVNIKNTVEDEGDKQEELLKVILNYEVDSNIFKIPEDYAEM